MKTRILLILTASFCVILLLAMNVQANSSDELEQFVNNALAQLNAAPFEIPQFKDAVIDTIVPVDSEGKIENANLYLCWLKNDDGRVGYIAVVENSGSFNIVAFSATTASPDYFLKNLQIEGLPDKQLNLSTAKQISFVENVPLVATAETVIGTEPIEISEIAASLSSILNYIQQEKKILLFGHIGFGADPEYTRRFKENPESARYPDDPNWKSVEKEAREAFDRENIQKGFEPTLEERAISLKKQYNIVKPIIRRRLLNPFNVRDRFEVIRLERKAIENLTRIDISSGMKDAVMLQLDYLDGNRANLGQNLNTFFKTRGRTTQVDIVPFEKMQTDSLPAILIGPDDIAAVLLGFQEIDGERFASLFFPKTGKPSSMSLTQKKREIRIAKGLPAEPNLLDDPELQKVLEQLRETELKLKKLYEEKGQPAPVPEKSVEERAREWVAKAKEFDENMFVVEDRNSEPSVYLENGVQIIKCSSLSSWHVLNIGNIDVGDNW